MKAAHQVLEELAHRISRLGQSRIDPEAYHVEKSAIAGEIRDVARQLKADAPRIEPSPVFHRTPTDADARLRRYRARVGEIHDLRGFVKAYELGRRLAMSAARTEALVMSAVFKDPAA